MTTHPWTALALRAKYGTPTVEEQQTLIAERVAALRLLDQTPSPSGCRPGDIISLDGTPVLITAVRVDCPVHFHEAEFEELDVWLPPGHLGNQGWTHPVGSITYRGPGKSDYNGTGFLALPFFQKWLEEHKE